MSAALESPLVHVERVVQERAKNDQLDPTSPDGIEAMSALVNEEVAAWSDEFRRGLRPFDITAPSALAERALRNLVSYGPLTELLEDDDVWEIMVNAPDTIFVKRHEGQSGYHHEIFHDDDHVVRIINKLLDDASTAHRKFDPSEGLQDAQLESGARVHIVHSDIARGGHVIVNIRKFNGVPFRSLNELVQRDMLSDEAATALREFAHAGLSIIFSGIPGSGKTTLLSCTAAEIAPTKRVVVAEEVFETDIALPNVAHMQTRPARADRATVDLRRLVSGFLRMAPDVAIVGEVRDREALPLLLTLSSGVQGFTTIHAGSARNALSRLRFIAQLSDSANELPISALTTLVTESIDIVVHCGRINSTPHVLEIIAVEDLQASPDTYAFTTTSLFTHDPKTHQLIATGHVGIRTQQALDANMELRNQ